MKKLLASAATLALIFPSLALAAFNDATLDSNVSLTVNSISLAVGGSGATVESIIVDSSSFNVTMLSGSVLEVTSAARATLSVSDSSVVSVNECNSTQSRIKLTYSGSTSKTVTISPTSTECSSSGGGSGGGGGGGGGSVSPSPSPTPAPVTATTTVSVATTTKAVVTAVSTPAPVVSQSSEVLALVAQLKSLIKLFQALGGAITPQMAAFVGGSASFSRDLKAGSTGDDVKGLQVFLNTHGYAVASSGPGSPGNETSRFGAATRAALAKFQKANGITPAVGYFGPKTRAVINGM